MKSKLTILAAMLLALTSLSANAGGKPAGAGDGGKPDGIACQQAGISTLQSLGLLPAVAKNGIVVVGIGVLDYQTVLELHRTSPELFDGGNQAVSVEVPGIGPVLADWCE